MGPLHRALAAMMVLGSCSGFINPTWPNQHSPIVAKPSAGCRPVKSSSRVSSTREKVEDAWSWIRDPYLSNDDRSDVNNPPSAPYTINLEDTGEEGLTPSAGHHHKVEQQTSSPEVKYDVAKGDMPDLEQKGGVTTHAPAVLLHSGPGTGKVRVRTPPRLPTPC